MTGTTEKKPAKWVPAILAPSNYPLSCFVNYCSFKVFGTSQNLATSENFISKEKEKYIAGGDL